MPHGSPREHHHQSRARRFFIDENGLQIILALILVSLVIYFGNPDYDPKPAVKKQSIPIVHGKETYTISSGEAGPKFSSVTFDPLDPKRGEVQVITANISNRAEIKNVKAVMLTDRGSHEISLLPMQGNKAEGVWRGEWTVEDSYENRYVLVLTAMGEDLSSKVEITVR